MVKKKRGRPPKKKPIKPFVPDYDGVDMPETEEEKPVVSDPIVKGDDVCVVDGCYEPKAPGQTHVCVKHQKRD